MNNVQKRIILFLFGCILVRSLLVYIAYKFSDNLKYLRYLGYLAFIPIIGWLWIMFVKPRDTGTEVFGGKIWWKNFRPVHTILYIIFAYLAITGNKKSWMILLIDVLFGLTMFLIYHYREGNFSKASYSF